MTKGNSIKQIIQGLTPEGTGILQGVVVQTDPLKIKMMNDEKHIINETSIIVPRHLTDYKTIVDIVGGDGKVDSETSVDGSHTHTYSGKTDIDGDPPHSHTYSGETEAASHSHSLDFFNVYGAEMTVYNALKVGETVHILSLENGKKYYVLDRVG